jgi:hypothetical protein
MPNWRPARGSHANVTQVARRMLSAGSAAIDSSWSIDRVVWGSSGAVIPMRWLEQLQEGDKGVGAIRNPR